MLFRVAWVAAMSALLSFFCAGCLGGLIRDQARETAAADHNCPVERVEVASDATVGGSYAYWLNVCGRRRLYRSQEVTSAGGGRNRFMDVTDSVGGGR